MAEANDFELCQYNEHRVEAENNCACVLRVFQSLPLARDGWRMGKGEGPRLRSVLNVCLFFRRKRRSDWDDGASHPRGSFAWQISTLSHELNTCLNVSVVEGNPIKVCCCGWTCWLKVLATWATREKMWLVVSLTVGHVEIGRQKLPFMWRRSNLGMWNASCSFQWRGWVWLYSM